ncbi:hypothetical protein D3C73_1190620 [compost metagenome]
MIFRPGGPRKEVPDINQQGRPADLGLALIGVSPRQPFEKRSRKALTIDHFAPPDPPNPDRQKISLMSQILFFTTQTETNHSFSPVDYPRIGIAPEKKAR